MRRNLPKLEAILGYKFADPDLLVCALTHRSLANELTAETGQRIRDNERMEFLGDAVLGLLVAEKLFQSYPEWSEGELTRVRAELVSRKQMALVAQSLDLGKFLLLSKGEEHSGLRSKATVLSNGMEAVLGALFLDGGMDVVRSFAGRHGLGEAVEVLANELQAGTALGNYKSALQEKLQAERVGVPVYRVKGESGPDHRKRFQVEVRLKTGNGEPGAALARGVGRTKKLAEQDAARRALDKLNNQNVDEEEPPEE